MKKNMKLYEILYWSSDRNIDSKYLLWRCKFE